MKHLSEPTRAVTLFLTCLLMATSAWGLVASPSGQEVQYAYTAVMQTSEGSLSSSRLKDLAHFQGQHLFGIFHSPTLIQKFGLDPFLVGGVGAAQSDMKIKILSQETLASGKTQFTYTASGRMLLHRKVAAQIFGNSTAGTLTVPLPLDPDEIYDRQCTDPHYDSLGDFWYFYDPFRAGCLKLSRPPLARDTVIRVQQIVQGSSLLSPRLDLLRGDNDNGSLFSIAVIHGYSDGPSAPKDYGRISYNRFNEYLLQNKKFSERSIFENTSRPQKIFTKSLQLSSGDSVQVEIRHLLVEATVSSRNVTFAKFFRSAVESADVVIYAGHSGLGGNLDIASLEAKAGKFEFNANKRQIFFFDSCASYSYYLEPFAAEKTRAKIDVITNGLPSYFESGEATLEAFLEVLLNPKIDDMPWLKILQKMERPLDGGTYLLNVGGL